MNLKEVAWLLTYSVDEMKKFISTGLKLPKSKAMTKLGSSRIHGGIDVSERQLNAFIRKFEKEEPGRHPPVEVRRELLVEANHLCGICRKPLPPQFHHMLEWSKIQHHDAKHMLVLCGGCHDRCRIGEIDVAAQVMYKAKLLKVASEKRHVDPHQAAKTAKDMKMLRELLNGFPCSWADMTLGMAQEDLWWWDRLAAFEGGERMMVSSLFFLYDKELWKLLKEFFTEWHRISHLAMSEFHDGRGTGLARHQVDCLRTREVDDRYMQFQKHVAIGRNSLAVLIAYIHEQYPEFDFDGIDLQARESYRQMVMAIRGKESKPQSNRKRTKSRK